jgi:phosphoribosylamine--glycine ligase
MFTAGGPRVLEFNCRLGDPETQALMLTLEEDLLPLLVSCAEGNLSPRPLSAGRGVSLCVVLAAEGYPQAPRIGDPIEGLDSVTGEVTVFHAGTRVEGGQCLTAGGRVLSVCASGSTLSAARERAYGAIPRLHFRGMHYRRDIGMRETIIG